MDAEKNFIDAWNAGKVRRVSDGAKPWVGLTDEEILKFQDIVPNTLGYDLIQFAKAIEAKLKEKNT
jgi:hypothetical protein